MALLALLQPAAPARRTRCRLLIGLGLFGAALLYGDGVITPAISVLGAVEGIARGGAAAPAVGGAHHVQSSSWSRCSCSSGVARPGWARCSAGSWWSGSRRSRSWACTGFCATPRCWPPSTRGTRSPSSCATACAGFLILGAVVLVVTGGEALYADMGHFGKRPIRLAWFAVVLPALVLNYFGQGALLLDRPSAAANPFYSLVPGWALYPMVGIATAAAVVASQALISGAFSLTRQAVQLGYCPAGDDPAHLADRDRADLPARASTACWASRASLLVLTFRSSGNLASRLRHRGHRHHDDHDDPVLRRGARPVALAALARPGASAPCF